MGQYLSSSYLFAWGQQTNDCTVQSSINPTVSGRPDDVFHPVAVNGLVIFYSIDIGQVSSDTSPWFIGNLNV